MAQILAILWLAIAVIGQLVMAPGLLSVPFGVLIMVLTGWGASLVYRSRFGQDEPYPIIRRLVLATLAVICLAQPFAIYCHSAVHDWTKFTRSIHGELHLGMTEQEIISLFNTNGRVVRRIDLGDRQGQRVEVAPKWPLFFGDHLVIILVYNKEGKLASSSITTHD